MPGLLYQTTMSLMQATIWVARRIDYHVNRSIVDLHPVDADPHLTACTLTERGPILRSYTNRGWLVGGFNPVTELVRDPRVSNAFANSTFARKLISSAAGQKELPFLDQPSIQQMDPPDHTRLRKLVARGFVAKYIASLAPTIERLVDELLEELDPSAPFDLIDVLSSSHLR